MNRILVSPKINFFEKYQEEQIILDMRWFNLLDNCGFEVEIANYAKQSFDNISGIILTGGNDLSFFDPSPQNDKRDKFELNLIAHAKKNKLPLLGVCRGAQLLAQTFGSRISLIKNHVRVNHRLTQKFKSNILDSKLDHEIVNSFHKFGIFKLGPNLKALAICEDNSIESFEHKTEQFLGIVWHPERMEKWYEADIKLITRFFNKK